MQGSMNACQNLIYPRFIHKVGTSLCDVEAFMFLKFCISGSNIAKRCPYFVVVAPMMEHLGSSFYYFSSSYFLFAFGSNRYVKVSDT